MIVNIDSCKRLLEHHPKILKLVDASNLREYSGKKYLIIYKFEYSFVDVSVPIVLCIPNSGSLESLDFYLENYLEFGFIPHVDSQGKICLYDFSGVLLTRDTTSILYQLLERMEEVLTKGKAGLNKADFIKEFSSYWICLPNCGILKSFVELGKEIKLIKYTYSESVKGHKKVLNVSDTGEELQLYSKSNTSLHNGIYLYIEENGEFILPPDWRNDLTSEYVKSLIKHPYINKKLYLKFFEKCNKSFLILFHIRQKNNIENVFAVYVEDVDTLYKREENSGNTSSKLIPYTVDRCDLDFLTYRGGGKNSLESKRILVVGAGSIGGYFVNELIKSGFTDITIVDNDKLKEENIYRHLLGMQFVGRYKADALQTYSEINYFGVRIKPRNSNIQELILDNDIKLSDYDIIISAMGDHNQNRWLNEYMYSKAILTPVIYLWNEILGIGSHIAFISAKNKFCYECLFEDNDEVVYDKSSYCEKGQSFSQQIQGCGSSFIPYSSITSLTTVCYGIRAVINYFEGNTTDNYLLSIKGDDAYFNKAGYLSSLRYQSQNETEEIVSGNQVAKYNCTCCGGLVNGNSV